MDSKVYSYLNFYNYIQTLPNYEKYAEGKHSLDRKKNDKNYERGNLRFVTQQIQCLNQRIKKTNKTGVNGIFIRGERKKKKYIASIRLNNKRYNIGSFATLKEAKNAYNSHPKVLEKIKLLKETV